MKVVASLTRLSLPMLFATSIGCSEERAEVEVIDADTGDASLEVGDDTFDDSTEPGPTDISETDVAGEIPTEVSEPDSVATLETFDADASQDGLDPLPSVCGDHIFNPAGEPCDDGNACQGDGCQQCALEPTVVVTRLALKEVGGFDLDDADADHDPTTGIDNRIGSSAVLVLTLNAFIADYVAKGELVQLMTFVGLDDVHDDPEVDIHFHYGRAPDCPGQTPPPWLSQSDAIVFSLADGFESCAPPAALRDDQRDDTGLVAGRLVTEGASLPLRLASLGLFEFGRAHLELDIAATSADTIDEVSGTLGGVLTVRALSRIDISGLIPSCPTTLHAVLGLVGQPDQDVDRDGHLDTILYQTPPDTIACATGPVVIVGCCVDGDCDAGLVLGSDCVSDPRIKDGFSVALDLAARPVRVGDQADRACDDGTPTTRPPEVDESHTVDLVVGLLVGAEFDAARHAVTTLTMLLGRVSVDSFQDVDDKHGIFLSFQIEVRDTLSGTLSSCRATQISTLDNPILPRPLDVLGDADRVSIRGSAFGIDCRPGHLGVVEIPLALDLIGGDEVPGETVHEEISLDLDGDNSASGWTHRRTVEVGALEGDIGGVVLDGLVLGPRANDDLPAELHVIGPLGSPVASVTEYSLRIDYHCPSRATCESANGCGDAVFDGCNRQLVCGDCRGAGDVCLAATCCTPRTSCERGELACGFEDDGCEGLVDCGSCAPDESCWGQVCCGPNACRARGFECGQLADCGMDCGTCPPGEFCHDHMCRLPTPPRTGTRPVRCMCADGFAIDFCGEEQTVCLGTESSNEWERDGCEWTCAEHGGSSWNTCNYPWGTEVTPCAARYEAPHGPNAIACTCGDGTTVSTCAMDACADVTHFCTTACDAIGGGVVAHAICDDDAPACTGRVAPPPGDDFVACHCGSGVEIGACTDASSWNPHQWIPDAAADLCDAACWAEGGLGSTPVVVRDVVDCRPRFHPAAYGTTAMSCTCGDGVTFDVCSGASCDETASECDTACASHGGRTGATCAADAERCSGRAAPMPGSDLVMCSCGGLRFDLCVDFAGCARPWERVDLCAPVCATVGGIGPGYSPFWEGAMCAPAADTCASCERATCDTLGRECGVIQDGDGCGGALACGACSDGLFCSAEGVCCTPSTCDSTATECGPIVDACTGATRSCGLCDDDRVCVEGVCVAPTPPEPGGLPLFCDCMDGVRVELCGAFDCEPNGFLYTRDDAMERGDVATWDACTWTCQDHGGTRVVMCPEAEPSQCETRFYPADHGSTAIVCTCSDGRAVASCSELPCDESDSHCAEVCSAVGGGTVAEATCALDAPTCNGDILPPPGDDTLACRCLDDIVVYACVEIQECNLRGPRECERVCEPHGGLDSGGCVSYAEACVDYYDLTTHGPTHVACTCGSGFVVDACATTDCAQIETFCELACAGRGGDVAAACEASSPVCRGEVPPGHGQERLSCTCADASVVSWCTDGSVCQPWQLRRDTCERACAERGGLSPAYAYEVCRSDVDGCSVDP